MWKNVGYKCPTLLALKEKLQKEQLDRLRVKPAPFRTMASEGH